mmetsp:Transcript_5295/g.8157  ORF Transcript_5295/g.8157 Transcript_5295/m.8157 type:complete len:371 (+) Transcript_5295:16-1128(+)
MRVRRRQSGRKLGGTRAYHSKRAVTFGDTYWKECFIVWLIFVAIVWCVMIDWTQDGYVRTQYLVRKFPHLYKGKQFSELKRLAVVPSSKTYDALTLLWIPMPYVIVKPSVRKISESLGWVRFMADNYDNLPEYVVFLHGQQKQWHSAHNFEQMITTLEPNSYLLLSPFHPLMLFKSTGEFAAREGPGVRNLSDTLFKLPFQQVFDMAGLKWHQCCAESVVSRASIRQNPKVFYETLANKIESSTYEDDTAGAWAYIMERGWGLLFGKFDGSPEFQTCYLGEVTFPIDKGIGNCSDLCKGYKLVAFGENDSCSCGDSDLELIASKTNDSASENCLPCSLKANKGMICGTGGAIAVYRYVSLPRKRDPKVVF